MQLQAHLVQRARRVHLWAAESLSTLGPWGLSVITLTWVLLTPRMIPTLSSDHGVFVSVAERLLAGDRLYADVWDNKDPLIYYLLAACRAVTPLGSAFEELTWMVIAASSVVVIGRRLCAGLKESLLAGLAMTPIVLTGSAYEPGLTHLPGLALTFAAVGCALSRRHALAGLVLGALIFTKFVIVPLALILVAIVLVRNRERRGALLMLAWMVAAILGFLAILASREELRPYLDALRGNVGYSQGSLVQYASSPFVAHLELVLRMSGMSTIVAVLLVAALAFIWPFPLSHGPMARVDGRTLWLMTAASLAAGVAVIAVSGLWFHHAQVLYGAAALAALMAAVGVGAIAPLRVPGLLALVLTAALLSGPVNPITWALPVKDAPGNLAALGTTTALTQAALRLSAPARYARVGAGDDGHAIGMEGWQLVCPRFHQYSFDPPEVLGEVLDCLPNAEVVLVAADAVAVVDDGSEWASFLGGVQEVLADDYECVRVEAGSVCLRRAGGSGREQD